MLSSKKKWGVSAIGTAMVVLGVLLACGKDDADDNTVGSTVEAAVSSTSAAADEQAGASYALVDPNDLNAPMQRLKDLLGERTAWAGACGDRALNQTCTSGVRTLAASCTVGGYSLSGTVALTYSDPACGMDTATNTVTRTDSITRTTPFGTLIVASDSHTTFDSTTVGGGTKITRVSGTGTSGAFTIKILGEHHTRKGPKGKEIYDVSVQTGTDLSVTGGIARAGRTIASGSVAVYHNLAKFKVTSTIDSSNPLVFSAACCYPIQGNINLTYAGTKSGTATLAYSSCGKGTITNSDGSTEAFSQQFCL